MKLPLISFTVIFLLSSLSCNTTEPFDDIKPGRRDYVWTVDTLYIPEGAIYPFYMWGTDENNVWAVGSGYLNAYRVWNYDGNKWKNYTPDKYVDPRGIYGFSKNDIWMGSSDGSIWHYNGTEWSKNFEPKIKNHDIFNIGWLSGSRSDNVYAVGYADSSDGIGYKGIIFRYNGKTWEQVDIESVKFWFNQILYNKSSDEFLIIAGNFETEETKAYVFNGNSIKEIHSTTNIFCLNLIGDQLFATDGMKLYKYERSKLKLFHDFQNTNFGGGLVWGRSEKDFFTVNWDGIGHFNGTDLITIYPISNDNMAPNQTTIFENDIFSIWRDTALGITIVIHGKLKT